MKARLELGAELDLLTQGELEQTMSRISSWQREAAEGLRHLDLPVMSGAVSGGNITLSAEQADGVYCGPRAGWYWKITRVSVAGLQTSDTVQLLKGDRFVTTISATTGVYHPGSAALILKPGDFLAVTGTGLTATALKVTGEAVTVPGPMMWKLL